MPDDSALVERNLNRARATWRWLSLLRQVSVVGAIFCVLVLALLLTIQWGWIVSTTSVFIYLLVISVVSVVVLLTVSIRACAMSANKTRVAAEIERVDRRFQDRLNTLLFLRSPRGKAQELGFANRIAHQASQLIRETGHATPFSATGSLACLAGFLVLFTILILLNAHYAPWHKLQSSRKHIVKLVQAAPQHPELKLAPTNTPLPNQPWGEVRITDPGADMKVTKVDVVQLAIEAAANRDLTSVAWCSSVNGGTEQTHALPPPDEPKFALYHPTIYLDELKLSDWDVMTYFAKAQADTQGTFASQVYFLEVRPFREDILKMPGGQGGQAYQTLNAISSLIGNQQGIIRETHQQVQRPPAQEQTRTQNRNKLSLAEANLSNATQHLYAQMAAELENKPIGEALDNLAKAQGSLSRASDLLKQAVMDEAQASERGALAELVAARKIFQTAVSDHPDDFAQNNGDKSDSPSDAAHKLSEMAEFRDETKSANEFVEHARNRQKQIEEQTRSSNADNNSRLGNEEKQLGKELKEFSEQHPRAFKRSRAESEQASQSLQTAGDSLQSGSSEATGAVGEASQSIERLQKSMESSQAGQQITDSYRLKRMLEEQVQEMAKLAQNGGDAGDKLSTAARAAKDLVDRMAKELGQPSGGGSAGTPLQSALSQTNKARLDHQLESVEQAENDSDRKDRAQDALAGLNQLLQALAQNEPEALRAARQHDSLQTESKDSFAQGLAQLESLMKQMEQNRSGSAADQAKQARQALANLQAGVRQAKDGGGESLVQQMQQMLEEGQRLDPAQLKGLLDQLERFSSEASKQQAAKNAQNEVAHIDPARLPPAYRSRIEKYFQKLSEQ